MTYLIYRQHMNVLEMIILAKIYARTCTVLTEKKTLEQSYQ